MDKKNLAFGKANYIMLAIGMVVVLVGFLLLGGGGSDDNTFNPEVYSAMHIKVAPVVTFIGFVSIIGAIVYKPKDETTAGINLEKEGK